MQPKTASAGRWLRIAAAVTILASIGVVVLFAAVDLRRPQPVPYGAVPTAPLRLSGQQFVLNWQSFPDREVLVEYCTVQVTNDDQIACRVFDGGREMGAISFDPATLTATSAAWARQRCRTANPARECTVRVMGIVRKGSDGRPLLANAQIER